MHFLKIFVFAIAVSLDGLGAGIAYGLKNIRIPFRSLLVVGLVTVVAMGLYRSGELDNDVYFTAFSHGDGCGGIDWSRCLEHFAGMAEAVSA